MLVAIQDEYDLAIVGSGVGALTAALFAAERGKSVAIFEKQPMFGGSSARSGGAVWIPGNSLMRRAGVADDADRALRYVTSCLLEYNKTTTPERIDAYLKTGPEVLDFLIGAGLKARYAKGYSDYYDDRDGGEPMGRAIEAEMIDSRKLGPYREKINRYPLYAMPVYLQEFPSLSNAATTMAGKLTALRAGWRIMLQKLRGAQILAQGSALQARLLNLLRERGVPVFMEAPMRELIIEQSGVVGVIIEHDGIRYAVRAASVLLGAGGFGNNAELRATHLPEAQGTPSNFLGNPGDTGEVQQAVIALGAATDQLDEAWWIPGGRIPDGSPVSHTISLSKPHCIMVDQTGQRYIDEAMSYNEIGQRMFERQKTIPTIPSYAIFDERFRKRYSWGMAMPGKYPDDWFKCGYMKKAETIEELAGLCGMPAGALRATVDRFNGFARNGVDEDFGRGGRRYDRMNGDPSAKPNPSLGTIEVGPFYAAPVEVGDVGSCGGLVTDSDGRVLREDGLPIAGLYAFGNIAASCFGRSYPGPGITLGQSMIFGYRAAHHALRSNA